MSIRAKVGKLWLETQLFPSDPCLHQKNEQKGWFAMQRFRVYRVWSGSPQRLGRGAVLCVGCWVQVAGVGCPVLHRLAAGRLAGGKAMQPPPPPSHAVASCCCPLLSKPKCFLISLLHFPEPFWVLATPRMAPRATPASGAQCTHRVQAAKSSHSWSVALGPAWLCAPALHRSLLLGA